MNVKLFITDKCILLYLTSDEKYIDNSLIENLRQKDRIIS